MGIALIVISLLAFVVLGFLAVKEFKAFAASGDHSFDKKRFQHVVLFGAGFGVFGMMLNLGFALAGSWSTDAWHMILNLGGGLIFFAGMYAFFSAFYLRYWRKDLVEEQRKYISLTLILGVVASFFGFIIAGEGMAPYLTYPLVSGFNINDTGFHWVTPTQSYSGGVTIAWYGVIIVGAAILAYRISDHNFYLKYGKHGILDTCFLIAFPCGIIGARVWYVVGNWNGDAAGGISFAEEVAKGNWGSMFAIWNGGLTILGGAVGGILGGMVYMLLARKYVDIRFAFDAVVPTILIAQAIGRFGNFFNHEVYGQLTNMSNWPLLPTWIKYNMATGWTNGSPNMDPITSGGLSGNMYVPLFLIEGILNILGFFIIMYLFPMFWSFLAKKITKKEDGGALKLAMGDKLGFYLIWYGVTRMIMEPLRDVNYNMGSNGMWSFWNSMIYVILGVIAITLFHIIASIRRKKGLPEEFQRGQQIEAVSAGENAVKVNTSIAGKEEPKKSDLSKPKPIAKPTDLSKPKPIGAKKENIEQPKEEE